jgi:DNA-directed RNA polymerase subunit H (RpoH/RPB5)
MSKENQDHDFNVIYKSFNNILKYLQHQGYNIESQKDISLEELQHRIETTNINFLVEGTNGEKCYVIYHIIKQLRPSHIHEYIEDIYEFREILKKTDQLIIITKDNFNYSNNSGLSDTIEKTINEIYENSNFYINIFPISTLQFCVIEHTLVPKHIKLNETEVVEFIKKYKITDLSNIPTISKFDAVSKAIGLRPGEICEITRQSKTVIESKYYRICI